MSHGGGLCWWRMSGQEGVGGVAVMRCVGEEERGDGRGGICGGGDSGSLGFLDVCDSGLQRLYWWYDG